MSKIDKIIYKINDGSGNLTFEEVATLLKHFGYKTSNKGHSSGSRIIFYKKGSRAIIMHKPHPRKTLLPYQIKQIKQLLKGETD